MIEITIPVSAVDAHLLPDFIANMRHQGGIGNHRILIASAPSVIHVAQEAASALRASCPNVDCEQIKREPEGNRVYAFNIMLQEVASLWRARPKDLPHFFCELDCTMMLPNCWDRLETDYRRQGRPFGGVIRNTEDVTTPPIPGKYMVAVGFYPPDFDRTGALCMLTAVNRGHSNRPDARLGIYADVYMGGEVVFKDGCSDLSGLICHQWNTKEFAMDSNGNIQGKLVAKPAVGGDDAPMLPNPTFLHHGCKDGSLARLAMSSQAALTIPTPPNKDYGDHGKAHQPSEVTVADFNNLAARVTALEDWAMKVSETHNQNEPDSIPEPEIPVETAEEESSASIEIFTIDIVKAALLGSAEDTLAEVALRLQRPMGVVRAIIKQPNSGLQIDKKTSLVVPV